jgi:hypothetical protein
MKGQSISVNQPNHSTQKFIPLKTIRKTTKHLPKTNNSEYTNQLKAFIVKTNPQADTLRIEFLQLISGLNEVLCTVPSTSFSKIYNSIINNYNSICMIIDFLKRQHVPFLFQKKSEEFYLQHLTDSNRLFRVSNVIFAYKKYYTTYKLVKTGDPSFENNEHGIVLTSHNQLEKIVNQINPDFASASIRKQEKFQKQVQLLNPWIESFQKGITYNTTLKTYMVDDNQLVLIPERSSNHLKSNHK